MLKTLPIALALAYLSLPADTRAASATPIQNHAFVSVAGNDASDCSLAAPCRHIEAAMPTIYTGGTITILTAGDYTGDVFIRRPMTITGATPATAITGTLVIFGGVSGKYVIENLEIGCTIAVIGNMPVQQGNGVAIYSTQGDVLLRNLHIHDCAQSGIKSETNSNLRLTVLDTTLFQNTRGIWLFSDRSVYSVAKTHLKLFNSDLIANATAGIEIDDIDSDAIIANTRILGSAKALDLRNGAVARSYGDNIITNGDAPTPAMKN